MLGIVGIGAGGSNIADEFCAKGVKSIAINYSQRDLDSLEHVEDKLICIGSEGMGKDRKLAGELMRDNWEMAVNFTKQNMSTPSIEVVLVCFSTGGGSGGGLSPILLELLQNEMPDKTFVACPILPDKSEVVVNQINCLETFAELSRLDICILPIDNEKIRSKYGFVGKSKLYSVANQEFVRLILDLVSYTELSSKDGVLDRKDLLSVFSTSGIGLIASLEIPEIENLNLSEVRITNDIHKSWDRSIFAPIEYSQVIRSGFVVDADKSMLPYINYSSVFNKFENGEPVDLFEGYYAENPSKIVTFLAGLNWINDRLCEIENLINHKKSNVNLNEKEIAQPASNFKDFTTQIRKKPNTRKNAMDILSKYQR